jgi:hypothetical protein
MLVAIRDSLARELTITAQSTRAITTTTTATTLLAMTRTNRIRASCTPVSRRLMQADDARRPLRRYVRPATPNKKRSRLMRLQATREI